MATLPRVWYLEQSLPEMATLLEYVSANLESGHLVAEQSKLKESWFADILNILGVCRRCGTALRLLWCSFAILCDPFDLVDAFFDDVRIQHIP